MTSLIIILGLAVAIGAAARSTWSPCGLSMLSSLTPLAESARGHRYRTTAAWFIVGGFIGGCALGLSAALFALGLRALAPSDDVVLVVAGLAALIAVASDLEFGLRLPVHHRQVNERWLDQFRPWVYGLGFGFQIGMGLATYIMTAALYLLLVLATLSQSVAISVVLGTTFGLIRGLAVLLGRAIRDPESLHSFHRRFSAIGPQIRLLTIAIEGGCFLSCVAALWVSIFVALMLGAAFGTGIFLTSAGGRLRRTTGAEEGMAPNADPGPRRISA